MRCTARIRQLSAKPHTFLTGVAVLTTLDQTGDVCGMSANGFVTVSLSPPTVLVAVMPGRMHLTLATRGRHCVNVLPEAGHGLSPYFAGRTDIIATPTTASWTVPLG
ncbi:MAG: flavin reductase family protein [Bryobacteraceae bacterium]